ncbi:hypothetical protein NE237_010282 [Protea cynaroides]|uniref:Uncharacterized protein n=1 Tax=Protea cynaroides TaxID=273540 RepID=A0A9Q0KZE9_9MAGN|nr:hypothetical protein NE237_010282 [Protea cynaroides]
MRSPPIISSIPASVDPTSLMKAFSSLPVSTPHDKPSALSYPNSIAGFFIAIVELGNFNLVAYADDLSANFFGATTGGLSPPSVDPVPLATKPAHGQLNSEGESSDEDWYAKPRKVRCHPLRMDDDPWVYVVGWLLVRFCAGRVRDRRRRGLEAGGLEARAEGPGGREMEAAEGLGGGGAWRWRGGGHEGASKKEGQRPREAWRWGA